MLGRDQGELLTAVLAPNPAARVPRHRLGTSFCLVALLLTVAALPGMLPSATPGPAPEARQDSSSPSALNQVPVQFVANHGQTDPQAAFHLQGSDGSVWFTPEGITMSIPGTDAEAAPWVVKLDFAGAAPVVPLPASPPSSTVNYLKGRPDEWITSVPAYSSITYPQLWPGIDLTYTADGGHLKYAFTVAPGSGPGADPACVPGHRVAFGRWSGAAERRHSGRRFCRRAALLVSAGRGAPG